MDFFVPLCQHGQGLTVCVIPLAVKKRQPYHKAAVPIVNETNIDFS